MFRFFSNNLCSATCANSEWRTLASINAILRLICSWTRCFISFYLLIFALYCHVSNIWTYLLMTCFICTWSWYFSCTLWYRSLSLWTGYHLCISNCISNNLIFKFISTRTWTLWILFRRTLRTNCEFWNICSDLFMPRNIGTWAWNFFRLFSDLLYSWACSLFISDRLMSHNFIFRIICPWPWSLIFISLKSLRFGIDCSRWTSIFNYTWFWRVLSWT